MSQLENVQPTIYLLNATCGLTKTQILIQAEDDALPALIKALTSQWQDINRLDGDNFNYHFLDELYGQLFIRQEQLRIILIYFSLLAAFIALLGLFSSAAYSLSLRTKEIGIKKVLGVTKEGLIISLNMPFVQMVLIANLISWPLSFLMLDRWLQSFAYRISLSLGPYFFALVVSLILASATVFLQAQKVVRGNAIKSLRTE